MKWTDLRNRSVRTDGARVVGHRHWRTGIRYWCAYNAKGDVILRKLKTPVWSRWTSSHWSSRKAAKEAVAL